MTSFFNDLRVRQLFDPESSTYTYLVWETTGLRAALIDPVREHFERDLTLIGELGLKLCAVIETHLHADHVTAISRFKDYYQEKLMCYIGEGAKPSEHDRFLKDGEVLDLGGSLRFKVIATPGHTNCSSCYHIGPWLFTGDTLLIRGCGRTDFQGGSAGELWRHVRKKIFVLDPDTIVYPGHDYRGMTSSTIKEEIEFNPRLNLNVTKEQFEEIMNGLGLPKPRLIETAPTRNRELGRV